MAFDIDKMKADGVSSHLIELASMNQETFLLLIARRLEHDKLFQQFLASNVGSIEAMYPYAVAAGLMSERDREWLVDEENPYVEKTVTITHTNEGSIYYYTEYDGESKEFENTLVIPKGTTLYFPNAEGIATIINEEDMESGAYVPYTFNEDATIRQEIQE